MKERDYFGRYRLIWRYNIIMDLQKDLRAWIAYDWLRTGTRDWLL